MGARADVTEETRDGGGTPHQAKELRSFGRRHGRKLSPRQQMLLDDVLPRLALDLERLPPAPLTKLFAAPVGEVWLEIGFGGSEHLIWQAAHNPAVGLIGCEPFEDGVVKALTAITEEQLPNVRLHADDARDVLRWLPPASVSRAFVLFPDPWPKRRHVKRRLVSTATLDLLARVLKPGAELRIASDIGDYLRTILIAFQPRTDFRWTAACASDWRERGTDWPPTRYEAKAHREGRKGYFLRFVRT